MAKGRKHYSGKELILRRQLERQQEAKKAQSDNWRIKTLQQVNAMRPVIERAKQRMREGKTNGVLD